MTEPVNRTILLFDIEQFGRRDDVEQAFLRRLLYDVVDETLRAAQVEETSRLRADRGDSLMELIDARVSLRILVKTLLTETPALLHSKNRLIASTAQMRLRIVLAAGYVAVDERDGWVGSDLNQACRLLDADPLRQALRESDQANVLCVSDPVYQGVVRHGHHGVRPDGFQQITVQGKEGPINAWLHGNVAQPSGDTTQPTSAASLVAPGGPSAPAHPGAAHVMGDQYGVAGGQVNGDLSFSFGPHASR